MEILLVGVVLVLIVGVILLLTGEKPLESADPVKADDTVAAVGDALEYAWRQVGPLPEGLAERSHLAGVIRELMERLGVPPRLAQEELERLGVAVARDSDEGEPEPARAALQVRDTAQSLQVALERALLVGIQVARLDDDYARVGDDHLDLEGLSRRTEEVENELFGDGRREMHALLGKASIALQDMLQAESEGTRAEEIRALLGVFDGRLAELQDQMAEDMARIPEPGGLLWGSSRDRRAYYFKMGVTNSLRRSGCVQTLGHLYRLRGVNYDVEEAYDMAAQECRVLEAARAMGIEALVAMGPAEVKGMLDRALPPAEE